MNYIIEKLKRAALEDEKTKRTEQEKEVAQFKESVIENVYGLLQEIPKEQLCYPIQLSVYIGYSRKTLNIITGVFPIIGNNVSTDVREKLGNNQRELTIPKALKCLNGTEESSLLDMVSDIIESNEIPIKSKKQVILSISGCYLENHMMDIFAIDLLNS